MLQQFSHTLGNWADSLRNNNLKKHMFIHQGGEMGSKCYDIWVHSFSLHPVSEGGGNHLPLSEDRKHNLQEIDSLFCFHTSAPTQWSIAPDTLAKAKGLEQKVTGRQHRVFHALLSLTWLWAESSKPRQLSRLNIFVRSCSQAKQDHANLPDETEMEKVSLETLTRH